MSDALSQKKNINQERKINPFSQMEEDVLTFWNENEIFEKSVSKEAPEGPSNSAGKDYVFYDGPPFATGLPHYGHIVGSIMKDVVPRYWTMNGKKVERKWGWDCHGLPIENIVEKEFGSKSKKDIEAVGVDKFNEMCRSKVLSYVDEWEKVIKRLGRWADMDNAYRTMDVDYMESIWWVFKQLYDKGLIYEGYRSMHVCPRCETTLSQQEVAEGYKDIKDLSAIAKFHLKANQEWAGGKYKTKDKVYILTWTTTPWTFIGNVALAVGVDIKYTALRIDGIGELLIVATDRIADVIKDKEVEIVHDDITGKDLIGLEYEPLFDYYTSGSLEILKTKPSDEKNTFVVVAAIFNKKNELLLGRRLYSKDKPEVGRDFWIAPGGKVEIGESVEDALKRELKEECNITNFKIKKFIGQDQGYLSNYKCLGFVVEVDDFDQLKNNEPEKFAEWKFFSMDNLPVSEFPNKERDAAFIEEAFKWHNGYKIYAADFVTTDEGTGVVHIAPAFGEDDMNLGKKENLPFIQHLTMDGNFKPEVKDFVGLNVKPKDNHMSTDIEIIKYLAHNNLLFHKEKYEHSYPHCWRCDTPLINYATSSWFVNVTKVKDGAIETAKNINWSPAHIKEGRFGKWLEGARDWSISRQRFWASVMPIWKCDKCDHTKVFGSVEEMSEYFGNPNKLFLVRHGEAEQNVAQTLNSDLNNNHFHLTENGRSQIEKTAKQLKDKKIDYIFCSPFLRAQETAEIISKELNIEIVTDDRLKEFVFRDFEGKKSQEFRSIFTNWPEEDIEKRKKYGVELEAEATERFTSFLNEINEKYQNKNIVVVSHGDPLQILHSIADGKDRIKEYKNFYPAKGVAKTTYSKPVDLHKHVVDEIKFSCDKCDGTMERIPDVLDTWFDSGSMPYAQMHYPFENKEKFEKNFPAEFIAEGQDQCRAWFYYLHVIGNGIKNSHAYNNVIVNGIVLAEDGKKMSKKLQNYPDPSLLFDQYGADALRYYLLTSHIMQADNLNFSEEGVKEALRKVVMILWNVVKFYELFEDKSKIDKVVSSNVLDNWILARLDQLIAETTEGMNAYNLPNATRPIAKFIDDLSTWYIRRSRDRFKGEDEKDKQAALATTKFVLVELSKIMAPFMPFVAEQIWQKTTANNFEDKNQSVHLETWPKGNEINQKIISEMEEIRKIVELGLAKRDELGIKIRQPLASLKIKVESQKLKVNEEFLNLIKDEMNVKEVIVENGEENLAVELDTKITEELKLEGMKRELVRTINAMRKNAGLTITDEISVIYQTESETIKKAIETQKEELKKDIISLDIKEGDASGSEVKVNGEDIILEIKNVISGNKI